MRRTVLIVSLLFIGAMAVYNTTTTTGAEPTMSVPDRNLAYLAVALHELGEDRAARPILQELGTGRRQTLEAVLNPGTNPQPSSDPAWQRLLHRLEQDRAAVVQTASAYLWALLFVLLLLLYAPIYALVFYGRLLSKSHLTDWLYGLRVSGGLAESPPGPDLRTAQPLLALAALTIVAFPLLLGLTGWSIFQYKTTLLVIVGMFGLAWAGTTTRAYRSWRDEIRAWFQAAFLPIGTSLLAVLALTGIAWLLSMSVPAGRMPFNPDAPAWLIVLLGVVVAPIVEEAIFRGMLYDTLKVGYGATTALLVSAAAFAVPHVQGWHAWPILLTTGLVLGFLRERYGGLRLSVFGHAVNNGLVILLFLLLTRPL